MTRHTGLYKLLGTQVTINVDTAVTPQRLQHAAGAETVGVVQVMEHEDVVDEGGRLEGRTKRRRNT